MRFKNLKELMSKFTDETTCREYLEQRMWNGKPECPYCQYNEKIYRIEGGKRYKCKQCQRKFSITVGTIFENSNIPLSTWFGAIYLITSHKKGISSVQLAKDLGVTQKTAWFMLHRLREMIKDKAPEKLSGVVEMDETYMNLHGKKKNIMMKYGRKGNRGRSRDKTPVFGIVEREGKVHAEKTGGVSAKNLMPIVDDKVEKGTEVMTDDFSTYQKLDLNFNHFVINHSMGKYVNGMIHTNTIEGFWSLFKRGIIGIYHCVSFKHLNAYCNEYSFRYNTRLLSESDRFDFAIAQADGKRLKYKQLTSIYRRDG